MENPYFKEVINGKLIEVKEVTVGIVIMAGLKKLKEHENIAYVLSEITEINGVKPTMQEILDSTDFEVYNFISECLNVMTHNLKF